MSKYIGVFDSGVGGLTVVKQLIKALPNENIVYLGDSKNMPYGSKTNEQIISYVQNAVKFLNTFDLKTIVIACNTADSIASNIIKQMYDLPIFGVIDPAAIVAVDTTKNNKIGVIATTAAINSNEYEKHIHSYNKNVEVYSKACPFLAPLIEEGKFDIGNDEMRDMVIDYLDPIVNQGIDTLILGCTHYDLIESIVHDIYPNLMLVSSSKCVIENVKNGIVLDNNKHADRQYYVSADKDKFKNIVSSFMGDIQIKQIKED